ncbi:MAG: hypothetical protein H7061_10045 [Bdellovibrionaceae bacterium]|nr:hypothetical protein [Bdellovibrio sp.]
MTAISALLLTVGAQAQSGRSTFPHPKKVIARSQYKPHVAILVGNNTPEGSGTVSPEFGVDVGYQPYVPFGLGVELMRTEVDTGSGRRDRNTVLTKGTYHFGGDIPVLRDSYVGAGLGVAFNPSNTSVLGGPLAGFDIPVTTINNDAVLSLGALAKYNFVGNNEVDAAALNAVVKYWY